MKGLFGDIYRTLFKIELAVMFQYRAAVVIWLIGLVLQPVIYLVVWLTVAKAQDDGKVGDFDASSLAAYFLIMMVVNHVTFSWHMWEMGYRVRSGTFNALLVQPLHPFHRDIIQNMAYKLLTLAIVIPVTALLWWFFEPTLSPEPWMWIAFGPAVVLAFLVRFFFEWSLALLAFWITDTSGLNSLYMALFFFLAGRIAPISLLPTWGQAIADVLPFKVMLAFPVELVMGRLSPDQMLTGFATQFLWIGLGWLTVHLVWSRASARYSAVGA